MKLILSLYIIRKYFANLLIYFKGIYILHQEERVVKSGLRNNISIRQEFFVNLLHLYSNNDWVCDMNTVEIITIGDEILIGQIVDTNSAWIAKELNKEGFKIIRITSIPDKQEDILDAFESAFKHADIVLVTGGIGPTKDDITKQTLCKYFRAEMVFNEDAYQNVLRQIADRPNAMNRLTRDQAYVPSTCIPIMNRVGTAPITWFEQDGKVLVSMPGVPEEMKWAIQHEILPRIKAHFQTPQLRHQTIIVQGNAESQLALKLEEWEDNLPAYIKLAYLPQAAFVRLRLTGQHADKEFLENTIRKKVKELKEILGKDVVATEDIAPEVLLSELLKSKGLTFATAESCTGGNIARLMTSHPGSSHFFNGSVIAYSNEVKENVLGVNHADIERYGAVSETVVKQMVSGAGKLLNADIVVATSGIAGPEGGTEEKPVGTVWIAAGNAAKVIARKYQFGNSRKRNIEKATYAAIFLVKEFVEE
jgi:nicotinamide-nucleotide amidase